MIGVVNNPDDVIVNQHGEEIDVWVDNTGQTREHILKHDMSVE
jgi:hypothetical protein